MNRVLWSLVLFLTLFITMHITQPACFYQTDGTLRPFGVGSTVRTVFPLWLISILLGLASYMFVCFVQMQKRKSRFIKRFLW